MTAADVELDALVVGAGFSGVYALHDLRRRGLRVLAVEAGDDIGGVWHWNRYPGARCDIESVDYCYSFSDDIVAEWTWTERYPGREELIRYINFVADRLDLRRDIVFGTRVTALRYDDEAARWHVTTDGDESFVVSYVVMASGQLSVPNLPAIEGIETFAGTLVHTGQWPADGLDVAGQRVGLIGTGSSGVQVTPQLARRAERLTVLQRTPHYAVPARNHDLDPAYAAQVKVRFADERQVARTSAGGVHRPVVTAKAMETPVEEVLEAFERAWALGGSHIQYSFADLRTDLRANELAAEFARAKIRETVRDPATAERLSPRTYPFGTKRLVLENGYYESFNRDNVELVSLLETPIERIEPAGVRTSERLIELDVLVVATGFDALTGALRAIEVTGSGGCSLADAWDAGPRSYLGIAVHGFPNLFVVAGAGSPSVLSNMLVSIEQHVEWIGALVSHAEAVGARRVEARQESQDYWVSHVNELADATIFKLADSWYLGSNVPGKPRVFMPYVGGVGAYREVCDKVVENEYEGFEIT